MKSKPKLTTSNGKIIVTRPRDEAKSIPGWATWDETQVVQYIENEVKSLAEAKTVLIALARLVVALRNETWPSLSGE